MYGITDIWDGILTSLYAIIFLIDDKKWEELKRFLKCQKRKGNLLEEDEMEIEII